MKKIILLMILLMIPLISAKMYEDDTWNFPIEYYQAYPIDYYGFGYYNMEYRCDDILLEISWNMDIDHLTKDLKKIRVWDNFPREGQPLGLYFLSNIIHIYDGCRNPDTLIHELAHLDNKNINHDSFFYLSYYRIKGEL